MHADCCSPASVQRGWSVPSAFGVTVRVYVVSNAPAAHTVNPAMDAEFAFTYASSESRLFKFTSKRL